MLVELIVRGDARCDPLRAARIGGERLAEDNSGCCGLSHPFHSTIASTATGTYVGMRPFATGQSLYTPIFPPVTIARMRCTAWWMPIVARVEHFRWSDASRLDRPLIHVAAWSG